MKTRFTLECAEEFDFAVLAINSHIKGYKLCWNINSSMQLNFEKKKDNNILNDYDLDNIEYNSDDDSDSEENNINTKKNRKDYSFFIN